MRAIPIDRFNAKITVTPGCWIWLAAKSKGYGLFHLDGRDEKAHRFSFSYHVAIIPKGMHVLHKCDNPCCVNPEHLFLGTNADNMADKVSKNRQSRVSTIGRTIHPQSCIDEIRQLRNSGKSYGYISKELNISKSHVYNVSNWNKRAGSSQPKPPDGS